MSHTRQVGKHKALSDGFKAELQSGHGPSILKGLGMKGETWHSMVAESEQSRVQSKHEGPDSVGFTAMEMERTGQDNVLSHSRPELLTT